MTRSQMIRKASSLPVGDPRRRLLLTLVASDKAARGNHASDLVMEIGKKVTALQKALDRDPEVKDPRKAKRAVDRILSALWTVGNAAGWWS
jgi:hypothetical protein